MDKFKLFGRILRSINFKLNRLKLIPYGKTNDELCGTL